MTGEQLPRAVLYFDLSDGCNLRCTTCNNERSSPQSQNVFPIETFKRNLLPFFPRLADFQLGCQYECLLLPYYEELLELISGLNMGTKGLQISNGTLLTEGKARAIVDSDIFRLVRFSCDGARKETSESIRSGLRWESFLRNIERIVSYRSGSGSPMQIGFNFTIQPANVRELPEVIRLAHSMGLQCVTTHALNYILDVQEDFCRLATEKIAEAAAIAAALGIEFHGQAYFSGSEMVTPEEKIAGLVAEESQGARRCRFSQSLELTMDAKGLLSTSWCARQEPRVLGNVLAQPIDQILLSRETADAASFFNNADCERCGACPYFLDEIS